MSKLKVILLSTVLVLIIVALFVPTGSVEVGAGRFRNAEFRVSILDEKGRLVDGVVMKVVNSQGEDAPCYPVSDYYDNNPVVANKDGLIVFHHVSSLLPEYTTRKRFVLGRLVSEQFPPEYHCEFFKATSLLCRVPYNGYFGHSDDTVSQWEKLPKTTQRWDDGGRRCIGLPDRLLPDKSLRGRDVVFPVIEATIRIANNAGGT